MKPRLVVLLCVLALALALAGCTKAPETKAVLTAELPSPSVKTGAHTVLYVDGLNNGGKELSVGFDIKPRNPEAVTITYPGELAYVIRPQETTGRKVVTVTATTGAERSDYAIDIILKDLKANTELDKKTVVLSVSK